MKTLPTFTALQCIFCTANLTQGITHSFTDIFMVVEFCLIDIQFSLLFQFMHRINLNRTVYLKETNLLFIQATLKVNSA